jgi:hypothetical protein
MSVSFIHDFRIKTCRGPKPSPLMSADGKRRMKRGAKTHCMDLVFAIVFGGDCFVGGMIL